MADVPSPRIGMLVVAYNAASTLASVLDRIPEGFRASIAHVIVADDASTDSTFLIGVGYRETFGDLPITVVRHDENLGYGGNQKWGYRWAMDHDLDVVVLLHGDGQYAPELLPDIVAPIVDGDADAVMGSRMLPPGSARAGGMPLYKFVGNRILTTVQNRLTGASLSEWHSGYRAYRVDALRQVELRCDVGRVRLRHPDPPPAHGRTARPSTRSRSRPTTATRSPTSTACATPAR